MNSEIQSAVEAGALQIDPVGELIQARRTVDEILRTAQYELERKEREVDEWRRRAIRARLRWYTEEQLAKRIGCSSETLARMRRAKKIPHSSPNARTIRYSSEDEIEIARTWRERNAGKRQLRSAA